jgi:4-amino-4-deoxy-L-arabinose transferase-like glycosyltransferase
VNPRLVLTRLRLLAGEHKLFTGALAVGALLRLVASIGYPGALWFAGDSYVYLGAALRPQPNLSKTTGYSLFLRLLLPFHSLTLVTGLQHLMGLAVAVLIYVLLRRGGVSKTWSAVATLPVLLDGYIIEDEHLVMSETVFTFCLMVALTLLLWRPDRVRWWMTVLAGLLVGYAVIVRTQGAIMLAVLPLFLLLRGWAWKTARGWAVAVVFALASLVPVGAYAAWFHERTGSYNMTMSTGFYLWGRVSSFADCARIKPAGLEAKVCPAEPLARRSPPGNFVWHAPEVHAVKGANGVIYGSPYMYASGGPVTPANNTLLTNFAVHAVEAQPLDYAKTVFFNTLLSFGFPRIAYPGAGTTYYYDFHLHYVVTGKHPYNLLPPKNHAWISPIVVPKYSAYDDWVSYGHQAPGAVHAFAAVPILVYQRVVFTYGPLLALIFLVGLGGLIGVRRRGWQLRSLRLHWAPRGTTMLPWVTAVALLVFPIAIADFDYRYLLPAIPFACLAAGLAFAPRRAAPADPPAPAAPESVESAVPDQVA